MIRGSAIFRSESALSSALSAALGAAGGIVTGFAVVPFAGIIAGCALAVLAAPVLALGAAIATRPRDKATLLDSLLAHGSDHVFRLDRKGLIVADCDRRLTLAEDRQARLTGRSLAALFDESVQAQVVDRIAAAVGGKASTLDTVPMGLVVLPMRWATLRLVPARGP